MMIKIFLVDDQCLMLEGIKAILSREPEIRVIGTAQDGQSAIAQVKKLQPDIVLIDIEMPKMDGITATRYICENLPHTKVIVLTSHRSQSYMTRALEAGASSYLLKDSLVEDLKQGIYSLSRGYSYLESKLLSQAVNKIRANNIVNSPPKTTYLKKYRKNIYSPKLASSSQKNSKTKTSENNLSNSQKSDFGINKANLAAIFELTGIEQHKSDNRQLLTHLPKKNSQNSLWVAWKRRYGNKIVCLLMAIASFVLSIIIF